MTIDQEVATYRSDLNLQELVRNATWRELLVDLIETNKLDPWDIDIVKVVDSYIDAVKKMRVMDLHIPANIILAASILLRMKSDTINILQVEETLEPEDGLMQQDRVRPEVPSLVPRLRLQPKGKVTLNDLMNALGDAIKITEKRESLVKQRFEPVNIVIEKEDIDEKMRIAYDMVKGSVDREGLTTFGKLAGAFNSIESTLLSLFVPLLFLAHKGEIVLIQDAFFNEIFVKLGDGKDGRKAR